MTYASWVRSVIGPRYDQAHVLAGKGRFRLEGVSTNSASGRHFRRYHILPYPPKQVKNSGNRISIFILTTVFFPVFPRRCLSELP